MCDLLLGTVVPIYSRFEWMVFLHGYLEGSAAIIILKPQPMKENIRAIVKPFKPWV